MKNEHGNRTPLTTQPESKFEPPGANEAKSLTRSEEMAPAEWRLACEISEFSDTGDYREVEKFGVLAARHGNVFRAGEFGRTAQVRPMHFWVLSGRGAFTPEAARHANQTVVLVQNLIHGGEPAGKDGTMVFTRDLLLRGAPWMNRIVLLIIPVLNPDGFENRSPWHRPNQNGPRLTGFRTNAQRLDLNRDFLKAKTPEIRAWLKLFGEWLPDLVIDNHTSDGMDFQYDITFKTPRSPQVSHALERWGTDKLLAPLTSGLEQRGHVAGLHFELEDPADYAAGLRYEFRSPRYGWMYAATRARMAMLVETHSLKRYRTQVWAHLDLLDVAMRAVARCPASLRNAIRASIRRVESAAASGQRMVLDGELTSHGSSLHGSSVEFRGLRSVMRESRSVGPYREFLAEPQTESLPLLVRFRPTLSATVPIAWAFGPQWTDLVELLERHGIRLHRLQTGCSLACEFYRITNAKWDAEPFEGSIRLQSAYRRTRRLFDTPMGTVVVPMAQPGAAVAMHLLEPGAPDSLLRWGAFNAIFEQKEYVSDYLMAPLAERMLRRSRRLKRSATDSETALRYFYRQSLYADKEEKVYPIFRIIHAFRENPRETPADA